MGSGSTVTATRALTGLGVLLGGLLGFFVASGSGGTSSSAPVDDSSSKAEKEVIGMVVGALAGGVTFYGVSKLANMDSRAGVTLDVTGKGPAGQAGNSRAIVLKAHMSW